jgi:hypothetical protein
MQELQIVDTVVYGSRNYGTETPTSDYDYKVIYVPSMRDMLLGKKFKIFKNRFDSAGVPITDNHCSMPDGGAEYEYIPLQTFIKDYTKGQTYAAEVMFALIANPEHKLHSLAKEVVGSFRVTDVLSMVGFAKKQTMDYISRARRLVDVKMMVDFLNSKIALGKPHAKLCEFIDEVPEKFHIIMDKDVKPYRGIYVAGRQYSERTSISDICASLTIIRDDYGQRVVEAIGSGNIDWKSISAAVRCYEQAIELYQTNHITFPRKNAEYLLEVKQGKIPFDEVKPVLEELADRVDSIVVGDPIYTEEQVDDFIVEKLQAYL